MTCRASLNARSSTAQTPTQWADYSESTSMVRAYIDEYTTPPTLPVDGQHRRSKGSKELSLHGDIRHHSQRQGLRKHAQHLKWMLAGVDP